MTHIKKTSYKRRFFYTFAAVKKFIQQKKLFMGRGDKKTAKGKRFKGSFGKSRPHKLVTKKTNAKAA